MLAFVSARSKSARPCAKHPNGDLRSRKHVPIKSLFHTQCINSKSISQTHMRKLSTVEKRSLAALAVLPLVELWRLNLVHCLLDLRGGI